MSRQGAMRDYIHVLPAGAEVDIHANGDYVRVLDAAGGKLRINTDTGDSLEMEAGEGARLANQFSSLRVRNESGVEIRSRLVVGTGDFQSVRTLGEVAPIPAGTLQGLAAITGGGTIAANADRRELVMVADVANVDPVSVEGLPLQPGDVFSLEVTGAVTVTATAGDILHVAEVI